MRVILLFVLLCLIPAPRAWLELPMIQKPQSLPVYTVWGRVTVREALPLAGAKIYANRIVGGTHFGGGFAVSDGDGNYRLEIFGHADALRIWVVYPAQYEPWGVRAPIGAWNLPTITWARPPASWGPISWQAAYRWTLTPTLTATPSRTPTRTLTPTSTLTPTITQTPTQTWTPSVTPMATATRTLTATPVATLRVVSLPGMLEMTPASTQLELMQQHIILGVKLHNLLVGFFGICLIAGASVGLWSIKQK